MDKAQLIQEEEYEFPYHYVPVFEKNRFSQTVHWSWGYRYLGGLQVVFEELQKVPFSSLIDVGCGDGRFLRDVRANYPSADIVGVDYSRRCIQMARAMNPNITYLCQDVIEKNLPRQFDVATAIEVLEHIHPDRVQDLTKAIWDLLHDDGTLILTVPHKNKPMNPKHYQHFTVSQIRDILGDRFDMIGVIPFDPEVSILRQLQKLVGGLGNHFVVTNTAVMSFFFRLYVKRYLFARDEGKCRRVAVRCSKK